MARKLCREVERRWLLEAEVLVEDRRGGVPELFERRFDRHDDLAGLDKLDSLDDDSLSGLEPRREHPQPLVVVNRLDLDATWTLLSASTTIDARPFLTLKDRLFRNDDGVCTRRPWLWR